MSEQRPPANRMMLAVFKTRYLGAKKGHGLLKKKRDALKAKFSAMLRDIVEVKKQTAVLLKESSFSLAKAQWANSGDDITATVVERAKIPSITCKLFADNVAGVMLPSFKSLHDPSKDQAIKTLGISHGGAVVQACREVHLKAMIALIRLASLQTSFKTLDEEIKMTSRRVNALEYVVMPKIAEVVAYIIQEIDEQSREEFFRVKKVVDKKRIRVAQELIDDKAYYAAQAALEQAAGKKPGAAPKKSAARPASSVTALGEEDEDIVVG